jgi:restriction endonuclease S subunit
MRDGWKEIALGEIVELGKGGSWGQDDQSADLIQAVCLRGTDLAELIDRRVPDAPVRWIKESELRKSKCSKDMVLIETSGSKCGRSIVLTDEILSKFDLPVIYSNFCRTLTIDIKKVTREFVEIWFSHNYANGLIPSYRATSAMPNLDVKALLRVENIKVPPLPEQRRIVDLISTVDSYIDALQQQLDSAKRSRNAVLHKLLTAGGEGWETTTIGDISDFVTVRKSPEQLPSDSIYVGLEHLEPNNASINNFDSVSKVTSSLTPFDVGDILFGRLRPYLHKVAIAEMFGFCSPEILVLRANSKVLPQMLLLFCDADSTIKICIERSAGTRMPRTSTEDLASIEIKLPPIAEQIKLAELSSTFDTVISYLGIALEKSKILRSGLLSDLLSGEHEIPVSYDKVMGAA